MLRRMLIRRFPFPIKSLVVSSAARNLLFICIEKANFSPEETRIAGDGASRKLFCAPPLYEGRMTGKL